MIRRRACAGGPGTRDGFSGRRIMNYAKWTAGIAGLALAFALGWTMAGRTGTRAEAGGEGDVQAAKGWTKGKGWGPWGKGDEVGALNAMNSATMRKALCLVKEGKVYDLGVLYDSESFNWPGHSPG